MGDNVYLEAVDARKSVYTEEQTSDVEYYHSTGDTSNPYYNYNEQQTVDENFSQLSLGSRQPLEGQIEEPTKNKGPKKWNDMLRHRLGMSRRKKAQTGESRKSIAGVNTGFFQKIFGRPSYFEEKDQNGLDSDSTSNVQMESYQQLSFANDDEEGEDSDEVMWSDNEFDEDNVYANLDDFGEAEDEERKKIGEKTRETQLTQFPDQSTQTSTQLTLAVSDESSPGNEVVSTKTTTCSTQLPHGDGVVEDYQLDYEIMEFDVERLTCEKIENKEPNQNGHNNGKNIDEKPNCVIVPDPNENPTNASDSIYTHKTTQNDQATKDANHNYSSVKFNVLLRNINRAKDDNGTGIVYSKVTQAEFGRKDIKSALRANGKPAECSQTNKWVKQNPTTDPRSFCCLDSETTHIKLIPANPGNACASKEGSVSITKPSDTNLTKPVSTNLTKRGFLRTKNPGVACVPKPSATNLTKPVATSVPKPVVVRAKNPGFASVPKPSVPYVTKPSVINITKSGVDSVSNPSVTCATSKLIVTWTTTKPSFTSVMTKASVTRSIKNADVDCTEKPVAVSAKERAVMFASLDVSEVDFRGRNSKEPKRTAIPASDADHVSEQSVLDTNQTQSPNILKMIQLFETSKISEKSSNQARSNKKTPGLLDNDCRSHAANNASMPGSHRCKPSVTIPRKLNPMSDQRSFFSANQTSAAPPPLPARKCSESSSEPAGRALPAKDGRAHRDGVPDILPATSSRRPPPEPENDRPGYYYLGAEDSASPAKIGTKMVNGDDVTVAYVDDSEFDPIATSSFIRAITQPLPPLPNGASVHPAKPKTHAYERGSQGGTHKAGALPDEEGEEDESAISGGSQSSAWRVRSSAEGREAPCAPSVPRPPVPARTSSGDNPAIGRKMIATSINPSELEEARKNLGKKPGRISSETDIPSSFGSHPKPPVPLGKPFVSEKDKKPKPSSDLPSENNATKTTDELIPTLEQQSWYRGELSRPGCEAQIVSEGQNGAFIVRRRFGDDADEYPYALSILHNNRSQNIRIRRRPDNTLALGSEKPGENVFSDIMEMVNFHRNNPIKLSNNVSVKLTSSLPQS